MMTMRCVVAFRSGWINPTDFEAAIQRAGAPHGKDIYEVEFHFPVGSKLMIDAAIRLLSLANQLALTSRRVRMLFDEGEAGAMGYLNRAGFFDHLAAPVEVSPMRPKYSAAAIYRGANAGLVEVARINKDQRDRELPTRLSEGVRRACSSRRDVAELTGATWTIFAELIDNVFSHSRTRLDGFAALQVYARGDRVVVAVSDSGVGIMDTLRPSLTADPSLSGLSDTNLLVEVFRQGISRHGADRGDGLRGSAAKAIRYRADLDVRLPNLRVHLVPARGAYAPNTAYCSDRLPLIWGTHIGFTLKLSG